MPSMKTDVLRDHVFRYPHLASMLGAHAGSYVIPGKEPAITERAAGQNMSIDVGAFSYVLNGVLGAKASTTNLVIAPSEANPRIDLLYLATATGNLTILKGTARAKKPATENTWQRWEEPYPADFSSVDGLLLAEILVPANATSIVNDYIRSIVVPALPVNFDSMYSVRIYIRGTEIIARKADGTILDSGVLGTDDTDVFDAAVAGCPDNGSIGIGPGLYTLEANKLFYLSGDGTTNPHYYAFGPAMEGKNCHVFGAGIDVTTLKLADNQHYTNHHAVLVFNRTTGDQNSGFTSFTLANLTLDGNRANQSVISVMDGPGNYLSGSIRTGERIINVRSKNSHGHGFYLGNNGDGPVNGALLYGLQIDNCYRSGICTDTARHVSIGNCIISNCSTGIELLGNSTDYTTRRKDNISVSNVSLNNAGLQIWCINGCVVTGCTMDITDSPVHSYGLQVHCSINVLIANSTFDANHTSQYCTYIDGGGYINDGEYKNVTFRDCTFRAFQALKVFGHAKISAVDCFFEAFTYVYLNESGQEVRVPGACVYLYEMGEPITATVEYTNCEFVADAYDTYIFYLPALSTTICNRCHAPKVGAMSIGGGLFTYDCTGPGLVAYNSRWVAQWGVFYSTPASSSSITMLYNMVNAIPIGTPIKYLTSAGGPYFGIVTAITSNLLTIAGPPLSGTIYMIWVGPPELVSQVDYLIPGAYAAAANNTLIQSFQKSFSIWQGPPAHLVRISHRALVADSGTAPRVTASVNGSVVGTDNTNTGLPVAASWVHTTSGINASNAKVDLNDAIELRTTQGGSGNSTYLTVTLTFVSEK